MWPQATRLTARMIFAVAKGLHRRLKRCNLSGPPRCSRNLYLVVQNFGREFCQQAQDRHPSASVRSLNCASVRAGGDSRLFPIWPCRVAGHAQRQTVFYTSEIGDAVLTGYERPCRCRKSVSTPTASASRHPTGARRSFRHRTTQPHSVEGQTGSDVLSPLPQTRDGSRRSWAQITRTRCYGLGLFVIAAISHCFAAIKPVRRSTASPKVWSGRGPDDLRPVTAPVPDRCYRLVSSLNSFTQRSQTSLSRSRNSSRGAHASAPLAPCATKRSGPGRVERPKPRLV